MPSLHQALVETEHVCHVRTKRWGTIMEVDNGWEVCLPAGFSASMFGPGRVSCFLFLCPPTLEL